MLQCAFKQRRRFASCTECVQQMQASTSTCSPWDTSVDYIRTRFPNLDGRLLQNKVRETYVLKDLLRLCSSFRT